MAEALLFLTCIICISLKKSYHALSENRPGDGNGRPPKHLHVTIKHTVFLNVLLDFVTLVSFAVFAVEVAYSLETIWALPAIFAALIVVFVLFPAVKPSRPEHKLAGFLSPGFAFFLSRLEKPIGWLEHIFARVGKSFNKAEPLSKKAIKELLKNQESLADKETKVDLKLALAALELNLQKSSYFMTRRQKAKSVKITDQVGPVLLSELHATGRKIFPAENGSDIAGTVRLDSLTELKEGGKVAAVLDPQMIVVHKDEPVLNAIRRFIESAAELVFAEDDEGEVVGIVYLEDVLKELAEE